jgi:transposase-like protein
MGPEVVRYSQAFKMQVVKELAEGQWRSREEARERYGIRGSGTVAVWVRKYGSPEMQGRVIRVESTTERDQVKALKAQIKELERALVDSNVRSALDKAYFDIVCREHGVKDPAALKKSIAEKLSQERTETDRGE